VSAHGRDGSRTRRPVVFISSTADDLSEYRKAATDVVENLGWQAIIMERWLPHATKGIREVCEERVGEADLVLALIGWRRGTVPSRDCDGNGRSSYTMFEIEAAREFKKPLLLFCADNNWPQAEDRDERAWVEWFHGWLRGFNRQIKYFGKAVGGDLGEFRNAVQCSLEHNRDVVLVGALPPPAATRPACHAPLRPPAPSATTR